MPRPNDSSDGRHLPTRQTTQSDVTRRDPIARLTRESRIAGVCAVGTNPVYVYISYLQRIRPQHLAGCGRRIRTVNLLIQSDPRYR
jgi:hypothetical protein